MLTLSTRGCGARAMMVHGRRKIAPESEHCQSQDSAPQNAEHQERDPQRGDRSAAQHHPAGDVDEVLQRQIGLGGELTVIRLGITGKLKHTLQSTNPIESMISTVRVINRNVKHWSSGEMCLRSTAAGMLEAETRFRKVQGYRGPGNIAVPIQHDLPPRRNAAHNQLTAA